MLYQGIKERNIRASPIPDNAFINILMCFSEVNLLFVIKVFFEYHKIFIIEINLFG